MQQSPPSAKTRAPASSIHSPRGPFITSNVVLNSHKKDCTIQNHGYTSTFIDKDKLLIQRQENTTAQALKLIGNCRIGELGHFHMNQVIPMINEMKWYTDAQHIKMHALYANKKGQ